MERNLQRTGLLNLLALLLAAAGAFGLARAAGSASALDASAFLLIGFLAALVSWFQMRLEAREQLENLEVDELNKNRASAALFAAADAEIRPARRAREQFERVAVPVFTVALFLIQGLAAVALWNGWLKPGPAKPDAATLLMTLFALLALALFVLGKYAAGVARIENQRLLRPGAGYLLLNAVVCFIVAGTAAGAHLGVPKLDLWVSRCFCAVLALAALETLATLVLEIYRPRVKGHVARLLYESRLIGLVGQPEGIVRTFAHALDYQFGFKVSETGFFRFIAERALQLFVAQLVAFVLFTTFVIIEPGEEGLLERFGRPVDGRAVLEAGVHFKMPWPVDKVQRFRTRSLQTITIGGEGREETGHHDEGKVLLWTKAHNDEEFNFLVSTGGSGAATGPGEQSVPVNLITVGIPVQFEVTNVLHWARGHADSAKLLEQLAFREATKLLVGLDYDQLLAAGRLTAAEELRRRIQQRVEALGLGVAVVFVGMNDIHPPVALAAAYEDVIGAYQEKQAKILVAEGERAERVPLAGAEAHKKVSEAQSYKLARISSVAATAGQFTNQLAAFRASPEVYVRRQYLQTLTAAVAPVRKLVLGTSNASEVINLNLEDKIRTDLLDVTLPGTEKKAEKH
ncbi:MAG: protease modulator HflK [Verrucomicrobia bacterium]|nr:protease modulator HflK [Verrucomicrobiota bacterium]